MVSASFGKVAECGARTHSQQGGVAGKKHTQFPGVIKCSAVRATKGFVWTSTISIKQ